MKNKNMVSAFLAGLSVILYLLAAKFCSPDGLSYMYPYYLFYEYDYPLMMIVFIVAAAVLFLGFVLSKTRVAVPLGVLLWMIAGWWSCSFIGGTNNFADGEPLFYIACVFGGICTVLTIINIARILANKCRNKRGKMLITIQSVAGLLFALFYYFVLRETSWYVIPRCSDCQVIGAIFLFAAVIVWASKLTCREAIEHLPPSEQLKVLKTEVQNGIITAEEYEKEKARVLSLL